MRHWGGRIRIACTRRTFGTFARELDRAMPAAASAPAITIYGSGDFHHVSLALLTRQTSPCNLLVLDKHPDWMRHVPVMHCGTWLNLAARLPTVRNVFHVGGDADFDNSYRLLAPRDLLTGGQIRVFPAVRPFRGGLWSAIRTRPLRSRAEQPASADEIRERFHPFAQDLAQHPLYISLDKDVLALSEAKSNWDAGHLLIDEVLAVISTFLELSGRRLAGADILGDWSPVHTSSLLNGLLQRLHSPRPQADPLEAVRRNQQANLRLLEPLLQATA